MNWSDGNLVTLLNPAMAFVAGVVASLHCVGMCGPLSCTLLQGKERQARLPGLLSYHGGRLIAYSCLGAVVALFGGKLVTWMGANPARIAPWAFALFFLALLFGVDGWVTRWQARHGFGRRFVQKAYRLSGNTRGLGLGLVTPLIPCGPLYVMLWVATMSGSALDGWLVMAAFGLGTMPLLLLAQSGWSWLATHLRPQTLLRMRQGLALVAVAVICLRAFIDTSAEGVLNGDGFCTWPPSQGASDD